MRRTYKIFGLIGFALLLSANECNLAPKHYVNDLYLINNADFDISCKINFSGGNYSFIYPDTILSEIRDPTWNPLPVKKGIKVSFYEMHFSSWEEFYKAKVSSDTISFVVYDWEVLENTNWNVIRDEYKILKRYDLSLEDLQKLDFTLYYPPTEEMKDMKMYPPYDE